MKLLSLSTLAFATFSLAAPSAKCKPGTYACTPNAHGWQVCDVSGTYVFAGTCPPKTVCKFFAASASPYCVPPNFNIP